MVADRKFCTVLLMIGMMTITGGTYESPYCLFELTSFGKDDPAFSNISYSSSRPRINGNFLNPDHFPAVPSYAAPYRGIHLAIANSFSSKCEVVFTGIYDVHGYSSAPTALASKLESLPDDSFVAGAVYDEGTGQLAPAVAALLVRGIDVQLIHRSAYAFVIWTGQPEKSILIQKGQGEGPAKLHYDVMDYLETKQFFRQRYVRTQNDKCFTDGTNIITSVSSSSLKICIVSCVEHAGCKTRSFISASRQCQLFSSRLGYLGASSTSGDCVMIEIIRY